MWKPYIATGTHGLIHNPAEVHGPQYTEPQYNSNAACGSEAREVAEREQVDYRIVLILLATLVYNALLAIANAHVTAMSLTQVALSELVILAAAAALISSRRLDPLDAPSLTFAIGSLLGTLVLSLINQAPIVAMMRSAAGIAVFTMLGIRCNRATLRTCFMWSIIVVGSVMILEIASTKTYSNLFNPFSYYVNTRGLGEVDLNNTGMFGNSLGFEGRFNYGLFSVPRTSSVFLEQTSSANFAGFCTIYLISVWTSANRYEKIFGIAFVLLALLSNNARMASALAVICLAGYFVFPRLSRYGTLVLPLLVIGLALAANSYLGDSKEDDLAGRIGLSMYMLSQTDIQGLLGFRALSAAGSFPDSGYSYTLYAASIFGAIALWLYVTLIVPATSSERKRCSWGIGIFFFMNLLIGGNAMYTVKIAAPLWLLAGFMRTQGYLDPAHRAMDNPSRRDDGDL